MSVLHRLPTYAPYVYQLQLRRIVQLWNNLQRIRTSLTLHVLLSGNTSASVRTRLTREAPSLVLHDMPAPRIPSWALDLHYATFAKLAVLNISLTLRRRMIYRELWLPRSVCVISWLSREP